MYTHQPLRNGAGIPTAAIAVGSISAEWSRHSDFCLDIVRPPRKRRESISAEWSRHSDVAARPTGARVANQSLRNGVGIPTSAGQSAVEIVDQSLRNGF